MTGSPPHRVRRVVCTGAFGGQRLQRILGASIEPPGEVAALLDLPPDDDLAVSPFPTLAYLDATHETGMMSSRGEVAIHVLWTAPQADPVLRLGLPPDPIEYSCAPGDFLPVPPDVPFEIGAGIVAVVVGTAPVATSAPQVSGPRFLPRLSPTHGLPVFSGYNRQTFGVATPSLALCRWKLTHPQIITAPAAGPLWLSNLVEPVAVTWPGGSDLLGRTEGMFLAPGATVTLIPNDLGYVLTAWVPNLPTDVIAPLRAAGYTNTEIASLGVPPDELRAR